MALGWSESHTATRSAVFRCSRLTARSSCLRQTGMQRRRATRMFSLLIGLSDANGSFTQRHKMKSKRLSILLTTLLLASFVVVGQQALEPSAEKLQQHISYLASDALDGRRTGTAG